VQEPPEGIAWAGEVMSNGLGAQARVDADEEDLRPGSQHVTQWHRSQTRGLSGTPDDRRSDLSRACSALREDAFDPAP